MTVRTREILVRALLIVVGAVALTLTVPAALSGWHTTSKTVSTESYIVTGSTDGMESRMYGDYCTSDTVLDGGTQCYATSDTEPTTWQDRLGLAFGNSIFPLLIGVILLALSRRNRRKDQKLPEPQMA